MPLPRGSLAALDPANDGGGIAVEPLPQGSLDGLDPSYHRNRLADAEKQANLDEARGIRPMLGVDDWQSLRQNADREAGPLPGMKYRSEAEYRAANPVPQQSSPLSIGADNRSAWQQGVDLAHAGVNGVGAGLAGAAANTQAALNVIPDVSIPELIRAAMTGSMPRPIVSDESLQHAHDVANDVFVPQGGAQGGAATGGEFVGGSAAYLNPFLVPVVAGGQGRRDVLQATTDNGLLSGGDQTKANLVGAGTGLAAALAGKFGQAAGAEASRLAPQAERLVAPVAEAAGTGAAFVAPEPLLTAALAGNDQRLQDSAKQQIENIPEGLAAMTLLGLAPKARQMLRPGELSPLPADHLPAGEASRTNELWKDYTGPGDEQITPVTQRGLLADLDPAATQQLHPIEAGQAAETVVGDVPPVEFNAAKDSEGIPSWVSPEQKAEIARRFRPDERDQIDGIRSQDPVQGAERIQNYLDRANSDSDKDAHNAVQAALDAVPENAEKAQTQVDEITPNTTQMATRIGEDIKPDFAQTDTRLSPPITIEPVPRPLNEQETQITPKVPVADVRPEMDATDPRLSATIKEPVNVPGRGTEAQKLQSPEVAPLRGEARPQETNANPSDAPLREQAAMPSAEAKSAQPTLSASARQFVDSLAPEDRSLISDSIAHIEAHPDPNGDVGNLKFALDIAKQKQASAPKPAAPRGTKETENVAPGEREYKRPDLANAGGTNEAARDAVKVVQNAHVHDIATDEGAKAQAKQSVDADPQGQMHRMLEAVRSNRAFKDKAESATMQEVMDRTYETHPKEWMELAVGQQMMRTRSAQVMQSFHDSLKGPEARAREARGLMATFRRPEINVQQLRDELAKAKADLEAARSKLAKKTMAPGGPNKESPTATSQPRQKLQGAKKALDEEFQKLIQRAKNRLQGKGPAGANLFLEDAYDLLANRVKAGIVTFADAALAVAEHIKGLRSDADSHKVLAEAWEKLRGENPTLDKADEAALINPRTQHQKPIGPKPLEDMIAAEKQRIADLTKKWETERDRLAKLTPSERFQETDSKSKSRELLKARNDAMAKVSDLRKELATLKGQNKAVQGPELPPEMKAAERRVQKIQDKLKVAEAASAKDFAATKEAAKQAGFDVDNLNDPQWKDPDHSTAYLSWLEGRHARTLPAVLKAYIVGSIHASTQVVGKKAFSDVINGTAEGAKQVLAPLVGSLMNLASRLTRGKEIHGLPDIGEYRHSVASILPALSDAVTDAMRVIKGNVSKFEAYSEHARINPLIAKTNPGTVGRFAARALEWGSLLTPVRIVHAFASSAFARMKVTAHAYRTALDADGKRLTGKELQDHIQNELGNLKSESWRRSVEDAQRATFTEPLPKPIKAFTSWKSSPGKTKLEEAAKIAVTSQLPFAQIPFNRVKQAVMNWSPIVGDAMTLARFFTGKTMEGHHLNVRDIPDQIVQSGLRWLVGWSAMSLANTKAPDGQPYLVGDDKNKENRYSMYIGNGRRANYMELSSAGPGIGLFADYAKGLRENNVKNDILAGMASLITTEHQDPLVSPILDTIKDWQYQPSGRGRFDKLEAVLADRLGQTVGSLSPSFIRQIQNAVRENAPDYRNARTPAVEFMHEMKHALVAKAFPSTLPDKNAPFVTRKPEFDSPTATLLWRLLVPFPLEKGERTPTETSHQ